MNTVDSLMTEITIFFVWMKTPILFTALQQMTQFPLFHNQTCQCAMQHGDSEKHIFDEVWNE